MTPQLMILIIAGLGIVVLSLAGALDRWLGPDPDLEEPWDPRERPR